MLVLGAGHFIDGRLLGLIGALPGRFNDRRKPKLSTIQRIARSLTALLSAFLSRPANRNVPRVHWRAFAAFRRQSVENPLLD